MTESIQSSYLPITLDTFPTHTHRYIASTMMLGFCMNPYATRFASSPPHGMYLYFIMFSQRTLRGMLLLPNISEDYFLLVANSWIGHFEYQHTQPSEGFDLDLEW
jgi:hypothetical protein